jgi:hypothetical protein
MWLWFKTSKVGVWLLGVGATAIGLFLWFWNFKRGLQKEIIYDFKDRQQTQENKVRKATEKHNTTTEKIVGDIPNDWNIIELQRKSGKKYKLPTD